MFNMFNCRYLDAEHWVLRMDYSVDCNDEKHVFYRIVAGVMMFAFAFYVREHEMLGLPIDPATGRVLD